MLDAGTAVAALDVDLDLEAVPGDQVVAGAPMTGSAVLCTLDTVEVGVWEMTPGSMSDVESDEVFVVIAGIVQFTEMVVQKTSPVLYQVLGIYLPLITTNCAVLGIPLLNVQAKHNFMESIFFGLGGALGFTMVMVLFASMRERLEGADVPAIFKGSAIAMVTAGLMSLSFMGFSGLIK